MVEYIDISVDVVSQCHQVGSEAVPERFLQVACGGMHTVALAADGKVWTWGVNDEGALGRMTEGTSWEDTPDEEKGQASVPGLADMPKGIKGAVTQVSVNNLLLTISSAFSVVLVLWFDEKSCERQVRLHLGLLQPYHVLCVTSALPADALCQRGLLMIITFHSLPPPHVPGGSR
jgi:hypothetical protein